MCLTLCIKCKLDVIEVIIKGDFNMFLNARCIFSHTTSVIERKVFVLVFAMHMPVHVRACMSARVFACAWMCSCRVC